MKTLIYALTIAAIAVVPAYAFDPIPGSLTYPGPARHRLQKAPVGSYVSNDFSYNGNGYTERYIVQPDRSLKLVDRIRRDDH